MLSLASAGGFLAVAGITTSHATRFPSHDSLAGLPNLLKRVESGGACGPGIGSCDEGLCCSQGGFCGTGGEYCTAPGCQLEYGPACHGNIFPSGPNTDKTPRLKFGNVPYGVDITSCTIPGTMAITFDDGPYHYTNELLDLLSQNGVVVTFFVTGMNGAKGPVNDPNTENPAMLRRMLAEGHQIASHSWSHENMESISVQEQQFQIAKLETALADLFGFFPTYYRPPYTGCGEGCIAALGARGYHVANYNLDTKDWQVDVWQARKNYDSGLANSSPQSSGIITLAHDIHQDTVRDLTQFMIDKASGAGYRLVTVGECLGDSVGNWYRNAVTGGAVEMAAIRAAALGKSGLQAKEKYHQAGVSSFPVAPTQPSRTSTKSTTKGKFNPTAGAAAKPDEDYLEDEVDFEYDDDVKGSRYRESSATIPMRSPGVLYAVVAIMVGVVAMF